MNISVTRIDDRLIHGQVATQWVNYAKANLIIIIDDATAKDKFMSSFLVKLAPRGTTVKIYTTEQSIDAMKEHLIHEEEKILILTKGPQPLLALINAGLPIDRIIVGGMGKSGKRKPLYRNISASDEERDCFKEILKKGCEVVLQILPDYKPINILEYLDK